VGDTGHVSPHFFRRGGYNMPCLPHFFLFRFCIWRGFKNKSDICYVLCEELYMLDVTHGRVDVYKESGVVSLILIFYSVNFSFNKMILSIF